MFLGVPWAYKGCMFVRAILQLLLVIYLSLGIVLKVEGLNQDVTTRKVYSEKYLGSGRKEMR